MIKFCLCRIISTYRKKTWIFLAQSDNSVLFYLFGIVKIAWIVRSLLSWWNGAFMLDKCYLEGLWTHWFCFLNLSNMLRCLNLSNMLRCLSILVFFMPVNCILLFRFYVFIFLFFAPNSRSPYACKLLFVRVFFLMFFSLISHLLMSNRHYESFL